MIEDEPVLMLGVPHSVKAGTTDLNRVRDDGVRGKFLGKRNGLGKKVFQSQMNALEHSPSLAVT